VALIKAL